MCMIWMRRRIVDDFWSGGEDAIFRYIDRAAVTWGVARFIAY